MSSWSSLPEVTWHGVAAYLPAPDVLSLLSTNREWRAAGRDGEALWSSLLTAQFRYFFVEGNGNDNNRDEENAAAQQSEDGGSSRRIGSASPAGHGRGVLSRFRRRRSSAATTTMMTAPERRRQEYLALSYRQDLPAVRWVPVEAPSATPPAREGHLSCVLDDRYWVITGGYSTDAHVYVKDLRADPPQANFRILEPSHGGHNNANGRRDGLQNDDAEGEGDGDGGGDRLLQFAYGASLTPINGRQAVQFGGFRAGGYSHECPQVAVLTLEEDSCGGGSPWLSASWQVVATTCAAAAADPRLPGRDDPREMARHCEAYTKRAYHTATLVLDRYLLVLGGMRSSGSIWDPAVLDTHTWRWTIPNPSAALPPAHVPPRHGHTALWDPKRSRVLAFGGGTGNDLLRSGTDYADVWATTGPVDGAGSLVRLLGIGNDDPPSAPAPWTKIADAIASPLSPVEALCLGRCHVSHCIAPDTVLLAFGSGRPSTNGVLAFNLASNTFFRPIVDGPLPCPRFTTTSVLWDSYLIVHGGFSSQRSSALGDLHVLDLAPALRRTFRALALPYRVVPPPDGGGGGYAPVTDEDVIAIRDRGQRQGMGELEALISLLHNRGNMNQEEFNLTLQNLLPAEILRAGILRDMGADDDDDEGDDDQRNLDEEMEE